MIDTNDYDDILKSSHDESEMTSIINESNDFYFDENYYKELLKSIHKEVDIKYSRSADDYSFDEDYYTRNILESAKEENPNDTQTPDQLSDPAVRVWAPGDGSRLLFPNNADPKNPPVPEGAPVEDNEKYENQTWGNALKPSDLIDIDIMIDRLNKQMVNYKDDVQGKEYTQILKWLNELKKLRCIMGKIKKTKKI